MNPIKSVLRQLVPRAVADAYRGLRRARLARRNARRSTEAIFTDIYAANRWGGTRGNFCSGDGSHDSAIVAPYVAMMTSELQRLDAGFRTAVDLGCGDFSVGRQLAAACGRYIGVDIVEPLIAHNQAVFGAAGVSFLHLDIVRDPLPEGDICFVRQVLQHLSNAQILAVLPKLDVFDWCFITEHHPSPGRACTINLDKEPGEDIRVSRGSGVFPGQSPFDLPGRACRLLLEVPGTPTTDGPDAGVIRTYLITRAPPP